MLLKWIVLIAIAWYVYRAAGNLIAAARGGQPPLDRQHRPARPSTGEQEGPPIRVVKKRGAQTHSSSRSEENVEDARFTDL